MLNKKMIALTLAASLCAIPLAGCSQQTEVKQQEFSGIQSVCELATLKCYYHNVAEQRNDADNNILGSLFNKGYKKYWIEYDGSVEIGIEASELTVSQPDSKGVVQVHMPEAKVLSAEPIASTIVEPTGESGWFTNLTNEDKTAVVAAAQESLKEDVANNSSLMAQAQNRAKKIVEGYIQNVGNTIGKTYTVEWI